MPCRKLRRLPIFITSTKQDGDSFWFEGMRYHFKLSRWSFLLLSSSSSDFFFWNHFSAVSGKLKLEAIFSSTLMGRECTLLSQSPNQCLFRGIQRGEKRRQRRQERWKEKIGKMMSKLSSFVLILHFLFFSFACRDLQVVSVDPGVATPLTVWHANKGAAYQVSLIFPFIS